MWFAFAEVTQDVTAATGADRHGGAGGVSSKKTGYHRLAVERKRDANVAARSQAVVQVAAFHDSCPKQLLLTAGFDQTLRLFDLDGEANELVASVRFLDMPVKSAVFSGDDVFCSGRRNWLYVFDLESQSVSKVLCGKGGLQRRGPAGDGRDGLDVLARGRRRGPRRSLHAGTTGTGLP